MRPMSDSPNWTTQRIATLSFPPGVPMREAIDHGLSPAEIRRLASLSSEQIERRNRMAQMNGLDPARLEADPALDIATAMCCADCAAEGYCRIAVERNDITDGADFCANASTYRAVAAE